MWVCVCVQDEHTLSEGRCNVIMSHNRESTIKGAMFPLLGVLTDKREAKFRVYYIFYLKKINTWNYWAERI